MLNLTVIITLYKTPSKQLLNLRNYKGLKILIGNQTQDNEIKKKLFKFLGNKLKYFEFKKNIGLSKSSNFLLKKVKTKFCLFTQADVNISPNSIKKLYEFIYKNNYIFVGPKILDENKKIKKKSNIKKKFKIVKKLDAAVLMMNTKKIKKIGFFDSDFFLYWEDVFLMRKINITGNKMAKLNGVYAFHPGEKSSEKNYKIDFLRWNNYRFGEYLYEYKTNNIKPIKLIRRLTTNLILLTFYIFSLNHKKLNKSLAEIVGIFKFIGYFIKKFI